MTKNNNFLAEEGIRFFGKMTAAATHEIKNTLAIINESAGLLEDLTRMPENGHALFVERVNDASKRMRRQVQRADLVLKKLNRFSHTTDQPTEVADLEKTLNFVLDLSAKLIERQGSTIEVVSPIPSILVSTNLFLLETMIWKAIETACNLVGKNQKMTISFGTDATTPSMWFSLHTDKDILMDNLFTSAEDSALIGYLEITIETNKHNRCFGLLWPKRI